MYHVCISTDYICEPVTWLLFESCPIPTCLTVNLHVRQHGRTLPLSRVRTTAGKVESHTDLLHMVFGGFPLNISIISFNQTGGAAGKLERTLVLCWKDYQACLEMDEEKCGERRRGLEW